MSTTQEAELVGRYLLNGKSPDAFSKAQYAAALQLRSDAGTTREQKQVAFAFRHPWGIGALDSALAFLQPNHLLRRKLLLMTAILETRPQHADLFLPKARSSWYLLVIGWVGVRAIAKAFVGRVLLLFI